MAESEYLLLRLVRILLEKTAAGDTEWVRGGWTGDGERQHYVFRTDFGGVGMYPSDWDSQPPIVFEILDHSGTATYTHTAEWPGEEDDENEGALNRSIIALYQASSVAPAKRIVESLIDTLLKSDSLKIVESA
jgi:hypothetical protein